jgi:transposase
MIEPELVRQIRELARVGWGAKRIAKTLGVARNTIRRYLRGGAEAESQQRPLARRLDPTAMAEALRLYQGPAAGNAVVTRRLLRERGITVSLRTLQRVLAPQRQAARAAQLATVRFETAPGHQMQIDFGQKRVLLGGLVAVVYLFVAVLSYSRRIFVRAFLSQRQDDWREALVGAFQHFGGLPQTLLLDNDGALVLARDRETQAARLHPAFAAFCRDWGVVPRICRPYRARTKGKTESGVKYVKGNALAELEFPSFAALEAHLRAWTEEADTRVHGTTHEIPRERFEREERRALRPLPAMPLPIRERHLLRRVANDCLVDVDTIRYSVPHRLVRERVEVLVGAEEVRILHGGELVARHRRGQEPHARIIEPSHYQGLWRRAEAAAAPVAPRSALQAQGRTLADYAAIIEGGDR